jgi:hypothetical protein
MRWTIRSRVGTARDGVGVVVDDEEENVEKKMFLAWKMTSNFDAFVLVGKREFAKFERFEILYMD